jgi:hypothetical protein
MCNASSAYLSMSFECGRIAKAHSAAWCATILIPEFVMSRRERCRWQRGISCLLLTARPLLSSFSYPPSTRRASYSSLHALCFPVYHTLLIPSGYLAPHSTQSAFLFLVPVFYPPGIFLLTARTFLSRTRLLPSGYLSPHYTHSAFLFLIPVFYPPGILWTSGSQ